MRVVDEELLNGLLRPGLAADVSSASSSDGAAADDDAARNYRLTLNRALGILARREHSEVELATKLRRKGHAHEQVQRVLGHLKTENLQSNERFAEAYVHSRIGRGYGPMHIRNELGKRGISEVLVEQTLTRSAEFWIDIARHALQKRFNRVPKQEAATRDHWNKQARFLARRGFPADLIYRVLGG